MKRNLFPYKKSLVFLIVILFVIVTVIPATYAHTTGDFLKEKELLSEKKVCFVNTNLGTSKKIYEIINRINKSLLQYNLEKLTTAYKGRVTGSNICYNAGDWIYNTFKNMSNNLIIRKQAWSSRENIFKNFQRCNGENIIAELPGKSDNKMIFIFSAHYDVSSSNSPGALDNGAGVAALLTIANSLSEYNFEHTIRFVAFSGEEQELLGSYSYAKECYNANDQILGVLNADVIGNNTYNTYGMFNHFYAFSTYPAKWIVKIMSELCNEYNIPICLQDKNYIGHSVDKSFDDYGYPVMQLFQSGMNMESFYGTENDTINLINISYLFNVTKFFAAGLAVLSDISQFYPKVQITNPKEDKMYIGRSYNLLPVSKGRTIVIATTLVVTTFIDDLQSMNIQNVTFELIQGENEDGINDENRSRVDRFYDSTPPYEWYFYMTEKCFGWYTIRATIYDEADISFSDEIEVFIIR